MVMCIYRKDNIDLTYDTDEDTYYISIDGGWFHGDETDVVCYTQDYTKEELINILKSIIDSLGGEV